MESTLRELSGVMNEEQVTVLAVTCFFHTIGNSISYRMKKPHCIDSGDKMRVCLRLGAGRRMNDV